MKTNKCRLKFIENLKNIINYGHNAIILVSLILGSIIKLFSTFFRCQVQKLLLSRLLWPVWTISKQYLRRMQEFDSIRGISGCLRKQGQPRMRTGHTKPKMFKIMLKARTTNDNFVCDFPVQSNTFNNNVINFF